ncbi:hypothetical protein [Gordonia zhaorongruii]|uniref:hypothetical protein n=1 Tax=Gordonia zhaorongruii TaxID=2597659 RepID=UPI0016428828|nr:hypothetical protein [Gordonia zhaorongruii]
MPNAALQARGVSRPTATAGRAGDVIVTCFRELVIAVTPGQAIDLANELADAVEEVTR